MTAETILRGRWVITGGRPGDDVLSDGAVLVEGDTIREVGPWQAVRARRPRAAVLGSAQALLLPGLINAHHHTAGASGPQHGVPDMLLESWLLARRRMRPADAYLETLVGAARLLGSGVTSVVDLVSGGGPAAAFSARLEQGLAAYDEAGIRVAFAPGIATRSHLVSGADDERAFLAALPDDARADARTRLPSPGDMGEDDYMGLMDGLCRDYAAHSRIDLWYGPPGPQWVSDAFLQRIAEAAAGHDTGVQTHVEESFYEKLHGPREYGKPTILHLHELGVLGPRFSIAHGVWLTEAEIEVMAETGAAISHNPSSNLRLRAGIAPLNAILAAGVKVALGLDGTSLDDDDDMFTEMRLALRLHRTPRLGTPAPTPARVLEMATAGGAALLGKETDLGRLAPGFAADIVVVDTSRIGWPWLAPEVDARELAVMRAKAGDVDTVLVGGEVVYRDGRPTRFDLAAAGRELATRLAAEPYPAQAAAAAERLRPRLEAHYRSWAVPDLEPFTDYNSRT